MLRRINIPVNKRASRSLASDDDQVPDKLQGALSALALLLVTALRTHPMSADSPPRSRPWRLPAPGPADPHELTERIISVRPFVVRRRARWVDCDPAGVVYTGRFCDYVLDAVGLFLATLSDRPWPEWTRELGVLVPCRGLSFDFRGALWPDDAFEQRVSVSALRERTFELRIDAQRVGGGEVFSATFTGIFIPGDGQRRGVAVPPPIRDALASHRTGASPA